MRPHLIKNQHLEKRLYLNRVFFILGIVIIVFLALLVRLSFLQIFHHSRYASMSRSNVIRLEAIPPTRGLIYDRFGRVLAENITVYRLEIVPEKVKNLDNLLKDIGKFIFLPEHDIAEFKKRAKRSPSFAPIPLKLRLTEQEVAILAVKKHKLPGISIIAGMIRHYPYGDLFAHVVGYVGRVNERELRKLEKSRYVNTHFMGKTGIEKFYENSLHGTPGVREVETDAYGRPIRYLTTKPPEHGKNLVLTIDLTLQQRAIQTLQGKRGAIVALDPNTGEVLALVSQPSFDPNLFVTGIDNDTFNFLKNAQDKPLFNRFLKGQYPPASTVKPIFGLAGLEKNIIDTKTTIHDPGWYQLDEDSRVYRDWRAHGHGITNLHKAIKESCDTFYYILSEKMGIDAMASWLKQFGFGEITGIDLPDENAGILPSRQWKQRALGQSWYRGETLITGIGQGYMLSTPLQLAQSVAMIANHGQKIQLHILKDKQPAKPSQPLSIQKRNWDSVISAMEAVVHQQGGTAFQISAGLKYQMAAKTGTAQVFRLPDKKEEFLLKKDNIAHHLRDHSLFIAFAPTQHPRIAVAVIIENDKGAALVARQLIDNYLEPTTHELSTSRATSIQS